MKDEASDKGARRIQGSCENERVFTTTRECLRNWANIITIFIDQMAPFSYVNSLKRLNPRFLDK